MSSQIYVHGCYGEEFSAQIIAALYSWDSTMSAVWTTESVLSVPLMAPNSFTL